MRPKSFEVPDQEPLFRLRLLVPLRVVALEVLEQECLYLCMNEFLRVEINDKYDMLVSS